MKTIPIISLGQLEDIVNADKLELPKDQSTKETSISTHKILCITHLLNGEYDEAQSHLDILQEMDM